MAVTILAVGLLVFFGHLLADFFQRAKVPDVLILMLAGIVLGPVLHLIEPADFGKVGPVFTTLALIIILFEGGIHLNVRHLGAAAGDTLAISLSTLLVTVLLLAYLAELFLPIDFFTALLVAMILGGTSSAVVVPLIRVLRMAPKPSTVLFLESALTDVVIIVLALGLLQALAQGSVDAAAAAITPSLALDVARSFLIAGLIGIGGAFLWSAILERIRKVPNTVFTTFAYVFILFGLAELWGYSGAIAALAFGIAVANFPNIPERLFGKVFSFRLAAFAEHERAFFAEAVFLVKTFFFVFLGVSMTFADWSTVAVGITLALAIIVARAPMVRLLASKSISRRDAALMTALVPKGLAAAVLASLPVQRGLANSQVIQETVYSTIFFSILTCAALVFAIERGLLEPLSQTWLRKFAAGPATAQHEEPGPPLLIEPALSMPELISSLQEPRAITDLEDPGD
ncbi:MAG: sodium:proton exchanger [Gemmatimonadales bacterium]|nr:sodium:proton exchanger [Gemmatimonadales bacterium]NIN12885.1 sodium:proton exchanger [Gemmatimonadales bacterium]NIR00172.1 sodium:proton exchanger [Gemmatimonadales bacterium]NIS65965.1 sodium:proton exchanger [Gemmatimonadales bacterium]